MVACACERPAERRSMCPVSMPPRLGGRRQLLLAGLRRRQSGTLSSGRPRRCREDQHIRDHHGPRSNDSPVGHPHRRSQHLHGPQYRRTCAEVRRHENGCRRPSQNIDQRRPHGDQATASVRIRSVIVTRSVRAFSHSSSASPFASQRVRIRPARQPKT